MTPAQFTETYKIVKETAVHPHQIQRDIDTDPLLLEQNATMTTLPYMVGFS
jgi:hypothetical protein